MRRIWMVAVLPVLACVACGVGGDSDSADAPESSPSTAVVTTTSEVTTTAGPTTSTTMPAAQAMNEMTAEVDRACQEAVTSLKNPEIRYDRAWVPYFSNTELTERAKRCADAKFAELKRAEEARAQAEVDSAGPVSVDEMIKNPDAFKGQVFVLVASITQYDGATGPCAFRGYWDNVSHEYNFDYAGDNAFFTSGDGVSDCPVLSGIDQNDVVRLWVRSTGAYSYDTQVGGNTTAPGFDVLKASVIAKQ